MARPTKRQPAASAPDPAGISDALAEVRAVYAEVEGRPFARDCQSRTECCRFRLTGRTPQLTRGEALVAAAAWRAAGRKTLPDSEAADGACPFLGPSGRCGIYRDRPFGCRTHFCQAAGGVIARAAIVDLIRRLERIDETLQGDGPKTLHSAVQAVWDDSAARSRRRR